MTIPSNAPAPVRVGATESTTVRSALLKQIRSLQQQEASAGRQLAELQGDLSAGALQKKLALQQQINGIEQQIQALQTALLQNDADRAIEVNKSGAARETEMEARVAPPAGTTGGGQRLDPAATVGSVIDVRV